MLCEAHKKNQVIEIRTMMKKLIGWKVKGIADFDFCKYKHLQVSETTNWKHVCYLRK